MEPKYFFDNRNPKLEDDSKKLFLFFDFDGTLVPIRDNPSQCVPSQETRIRLSAIALSRMAFVAILTGRTVKDIAKRVSLLGIYYGGSHGLEISGPDFTYVHPHAIKGRRAINTIYRTFQKSLDGMEGIFLEKKKFGFSLHYRMAERKIRASVKKIFYKVIAEELESNTFSVLRGKKVLELVPNIQWDKGKAALFLLEKFNERCLPVYVGDDVTDETAFNALKEHGITIRVGKSKQTQAEYYLRGQWEVLRLLQYLYGLLNQRNKQ